MYVKELKSLFLLCNNLQVTMSKYPSEIITDTSIDKYLTDDAFANIRVPAYDNNIINKVLYYASQFLETEKTYNVNGAYNFGLVPYYYSQKFINSQSSLHNTFNDLVNEYIINTYNYRYNTVNVYRIKMLFVHLLAVLTDNIDNEDINMTIDDIIVNKFSTLKVIQNVVDTYDITKKGVFKHGTFIKHVFDKVINTFYKGQYPNSFLIRIYVIKKWIESNNITKDNIITYRSQLGDLYDTAVYCLSEKTLEEEIDSIVNAINISIGEIIDSLDDNMRIPNDNNQRLAEIMLQERYLDRHYLVYIYTSFIIYHVAPNCDGSNHPVTMRIPSLNDYDSGNGRTAEFLLSKVYEDIINYAIYNTLVNQSDYYTGESWSDWTYAKQVADRDILHFKDNITVMNVNKFLTYLIGTICPSTFHPSIHDVSKSVPSIKNSYSDEQTYCHFIDNITMRNVYNIYNIDTQYVIINNGVTIDFSADIHTIIAGLIDWSSKFYMLFKPLKNLWNYYYRVNKVNNYDAFATMATTIGDNIAVNNDNTGGDLYSVYDGIFTLIDVKNYDYSDKYNTSAKLRNLYYHTILQTWLYMNAYIQPIGMVNNKRLYDTYCVEVVNPYLNDVIICDYDKVSEFTKDIDLSKYRFNTAM